MTSYRLRRVAVLAGIAVVLGDVGPLTAQSKTNDGWVLALPKRRAPSPALPTLPELPSAANTVVPATIRLAVQAAGPRNKPDHQTITRTVERVHVAREDGREWLFERNPVDPRRVSAAAVEHASREIVLYAESDLRMTMGIRGWADVLLLGFDPERLASYKPTTMTRRIGGVTFTRYSSASGRPTASADIWWNGQQQLASDFTIPGRTGASRLLLDSISPHIDAEKLESPIKRFPSYTVINVADWMEQH